MQVGAVGPEHGQPRLEEVVDLVGRTSVRQLLHAVWGSSEVTGGVTCLLHVCAALQRPYVAVAGAREHVPWGWYSRANPGLPGAENLLVEQKYLHTTGVFDCSAVPGWSVLGACHARDLTPQPGRLCCCRPDPAQGSVAARCLGLITPEHVLSALDSFASSPFGL